MTRRFAVVAEADADADHRTATELADRVLVEAVDWLDDDQLPFQREWVVEAAGGQLTWKRLRGLAGAAGIEPLDGHFDGEPGLPDARAARRALRYLRATGPDLSAVILVRDRDDQPSRRGGLEQARREAHDGPVIVVGLAIVEREAWVLSGYVAADPAEITRLAAERQALGFNPCERSHELTACKDDSARRSPKRILLQLTDGDPARERLCWTATTLTHLSQHGADNGLADYLDEVRTRLAPLIGHVAAG